MAGPVDLAGQSRRRGGRPVPTEDRANAGYHIEGSYDGSGNAPTPARVLLEPGVPEFLARTVGALNGNASIDNWS